MESAMKTLRAMLSFVDEAGRYRCPQCGQYACLSEMGTLSKGSARLSVTAYGHLSGFGCNQKTYELPTGQAPEFLTPNREDYAFA